MLGLFSRDNSARQKNGEKKPEEANSDPKIEFFTEVEALPDIVPIQAGARSMPAWWKQTPAAAPSTDPRIEAGTVKVCPAFPDFYSAAYVVPAWCDFIFDFNDGNVRARTSAPDIFSLSFHGAGQFLQHGPASLREKVVTVMKLNSPWLVRTSPGYSVLQLPMFYEFDPRFSVMPGTIRSDVHHEINQQVMIHVKDSFVVERGTPLAMYIPFKREQFAFSAGEATDEQRHALKKSLLEIETKFRRGYRKNTGQG
ncbi:MAG: hypothetical protein AAFN78_03535 [Pseudomonadota bacterium]